jgi:hypothetical protein
MPVERRGWVIAFEIGSTGNERNPIFNGRRQPSCGGTSRMTRECQVRICEGLGVKFPGPTRHEGRNQPIQPGKLSPRHSKSGGNSGRCCSAGTALMGQRRPSANYSITSSANASSRSGIVRPSALAVLRLTANSNLTGACTGRSAGLTPLRMRSTYAAARGN